jgi:hypothetical protein
VSANPCRHTIGKPLPPRCDAVKLNVTGARRVRP